MEEIEKEMITSIEAARLLGLSEGWLRKMRSTEGAARIPFFRIGRAVRYERQAVLAYRSSCRVMVGA